MFGYYNFWAIFIFSIDIFICYYSGKTNLINIMNLNSGLLTFVCISEDSIDWTQQLIGRNRISIFNILFTLIIVLLSFIAIPILFNFKAYLYVLIIMFIAYLVILLKASRLSWNHLNLSNQSFWGGFLNLSMFILFITVYTIQAYATATYIVVHYIPGNELVSNGPVQLPSLPLL